MKMVLFSDVHGNLPALEELITITQTYSEETYYYCLGDTLGYGPWPMDCLERVFQICDEVLLGWNDLVGILGTIPHPANPPSAAREDWLLNVRTAWNTPPHESAWKQHGQRIDRSSPLIQRLAKCKIESHGMFYKSHHHIPHQSRPPREAIAFVGHLATVHESGCYDYLGMLGGKRCRITATGSLGMSAYATNLIEWAEYDTEEKIVSLMSATYDDTKYIQEIRKMGYSPTVEDALLIRASDRAPKFMPCECHQDAHIELPAWNPEKPYPEWDSDAA